jgi:hypothetical protein
MQRIQSIILMLPLMCLLHSKIAAQICPNFTIENKYDFVNVSFLFNNQSAQELFANKNAGNRFQDLRYTITLDFDHDKIFWTSADFQGINTLVHDITSVKYEDELLVIKCIMFHPSHKQLVNETMLLNMEEKTCLYYYEQSEEYQDPSLQAAGINAVVTAAEYFEFK